MVKVCSYGPCNSNIKRKSNSVKGAPGVTFIKFPSPKTELAKCQRWVDACGRKDFTISNVTRFSSICSRHFDGFQGPTKDNPDPIPLLDVLTPKMIRTPPDNTLENQPNLGVLSSPETQSITPAELPASVIDLSSNQNKAPSTFTRKQICLEKNVTSINIDSQSLSLNDFKPLSGWSLEITENQAVYCKHQNNFKVIQCIIFKEETYLVKLMALDKEISIVTIQPSFSLTSNDDIYGLLKKLKEYCICSGNPDTDMIQLYKKRKSQRQSVSRYHKILKTIYSNDCHSLITTKRKRCQACVKYRGSLRKLRHDQSLKISNKQTKANQLLKKTKKNLLLEEKFSSERKMMNTILKQKLQNEPKNSLSAIFIQQQLKALTRSKKGMRWDPRFLKWCCYLKNKSKSTYEAMRRSAALCLPTTRTLYNHNHFVSNSCGFNNDLLDHMAMDLKIENLNEHEKYFAILLDEMKIKEDLVSHKTTGNLTGFVDLSKELNELDDLNRKLNDDTKPPLATHVLQLMLRGLTSDIRIPFAHFPTNNASGAALHVILWKAVQLLEERGFRILAIVGDGAVSNRKFFRMNAEDSEEGIGYSTVNLFANDEERDIYFLSDAPHLIKTTRNAFSSSSKTSKVRLLWVNGQEITWNVIIRLYYHQLRAKGEFKHLTNLTYGHVFLDSFSKMKVNYAAQILSETVASAIETLFGNNNPDYIETVKFIRIFNKFFDVCNVKNCTEARHKRKEDKKPYEDENDERLRWLEHDFLQYLKNWEMQVNQREGEYKKSERAKMILSKETLYGLKMTALSTVRIVRFLLRKGADYVLTQHFNQDPLEQEFGRHRAAGGRNNNPSVCQYESNIDKLRSLKGFVLEAIGGNTTISD